MSEEEKNVANESQSNNEPIVIEEEVTLAQASDAEQEDNPSARKRRRSKKVETGADRRKKRIRGWIITACVLGVIGLLVAVLAIVNAVGCKGLMQQAKAMEPVDYTGAPKEKDADGYYFVTDGNFKVMQLTDVHIGAGFMSTQKDSWAMNAVANMIRKEKPDLVIVTGDIAYPVPFQAGTFNNLRAAQIFATEMESLHVNWTFAFGNHDTEAYSRYTRKQICDWYAAQNFEYCLFMANNDLADKDAAESFGYGNNVIRVKNSAGIVTQALVTFDSHSYTDKDYFGALWKYDNIHQDQIDWYTSEMAKIRAANAAKGYDGVVKNLSFFHIPLREYRRAWGEYADNGYADTANVVKVYGVNGEEVGASQNPLAKESEPTYGVYCGVYKEELDGKFWQAALENGMQGTFCGHDHLNNFSINYTNAGGTIRLTYGMSVDYLAYSGIFQQHSQRGCTVITVAPNGDFTCQARNYYVDYGIEPEAGDLSDIQ